MPELGGGRGATGLPPIFDRSVNPIPTGEGTLSPTITTGPPSVFHLPASLNYDLTTFVLKNHRRLFEKYAVARTEHDALVRSKTKIFSNFVAFSGNPNFIKTVLFCR